MRRFSYIFLELTSTEEKILPPLIASKGLFKSSEKMLKEMTATSKNACQLFYQSIIFKLRRTGSFRIDASMYGRRTLSRCLLPYHDLSKALMSSLIVSYKIPSPGSDLIYDSTRHFHAITSLLIPNNIGVPEHADKSKCFIPSQIAHHLTDDVLFVQCLCK